jgi:hypothetical protein
MIAVSSYAILIQVQGGNGRDNGLHDLPHPVPEIRDAQLGIEAKRTGNVPPCFVLTPGADVADSGDSNAAQVIRLFSGCRFRQGPGLVETAGNEMRECRKALHKEKLWIERAEPHGTRQLLNSQVRVAVTGSQMSAGAPGGRQIRIEHQRAIAHRNSCFSIAGDVTERESAEG